MFCNDLFADHGIEPCFEAGAMQRDATLRVCGHREDAFLSCTFPRRHLSLATSHLRCARRLSDMCGWLSTWIRLSVDGLNTWREFVVPSPLSLITVIVEGKDGDATKSRV